MPTPNDSVLDRANDYKKLQDARDHSFGEWIGDLRGTDMVRGFAGVLNWGLFLSPPAHPAPVILPAKPKGRCREDYGCGVGGGDRNKDFP